MRKAIRHAAVWSAMLLPLGCGEEEASKAETSPDTKAESAAAQPAAPAALMVTGRMTTADGKPITTPGVKFSVTITGTRSNGISVSFNPPVAADGSYKQKVTEGVYRVGPARVRVPYGEEVFNLDLYPTGDAADSDREASDGIVQDFAWKLTGKRKLYENIKGDPNNHTHWHGMNLGMRLAGYREDLKQPTTPPPDGTKLVFTLTPAGTKKAIDGSDLTPVTFERVWDSRKTSVGQDLNDFVPGEYEVAGVATLPDGASKKILFMTSDDYPNFRPTGKVTLQLDGILGGMWKQPMTYVLE
jgi:hypothetical protein